MQQHPVIGNVRVMGVSLTTVQEIWLWFLLPAVLRCFAYMIDLSFACGVLHHHFKQGDIRWGISTLIIIYTPSIVFFIMTVSKPNVWDEQGKTMKKVRWFLARLAQLLMFPIWAIYRYGKRIFWSTEALFQQGSSREQALDRASSPSQIELYLFLHAFLHAVPQVALQLYIVLHQYGEHIIIDHTQVLCVTSSLVLLTLTVVSFQRFESQRMAGRREPWVVPSDKVGGVFPTKPSVTLTTTNNEKPHTILDQASDDDSDFVLYPLDLSPEITVIPPTPTLSSLSQPSPREEDSMLRHSGRATRASNDREDASTEVQVLSPPAEPPPPPPLTLDLPKRRIPVKGIELDDPLGLSVAFVWWFSFLLSRALALTTFAQFYPGITAAVCVVHCAAATAYLLSISKFPSIYKVSQQLCLGFIYLFCLIEYKTKFERVKILYATYFFAVFAENPAISLVWWYKDELWDGWWYNYIFIIIFCSYMMSMFALGLYMVLLKPKVTSFYVD